MCNANDGRPLRESFYKLLSAKSLELQATKQKLGPEESEERNDARGETLDFLAEASVGRVAEEFSRDATMVMALHQQLGRHKQEVVSRVLRAIYPSWAGEPDDLKASARVSLE